MAIFVLIFTLICTAPARATTLAQIQNDITAIINNSNSNVQWSVLIENQWGTQSYYSLNPTTPRRPASVTKVFTTAAAMEILGPGYVWRGYQLQSSSTASPVEAVLSSSDNFLADELYSLAGGGTPIINRLGQMGVNTSGMQMFDGSGLLYDNRFSSRQTIDVMRFMMNKYSYGQWATHLAISCTKGTLGSRLCGTNTSGVVHAKTGTLTNGGTLSLGGYIDNKFDGQRYYFAIFTNNVPSTWQADTRSRIDSIVAVMGQNNIPNPGPSLGGVIVDNGTAGYSETGSWGASASSGFYGSNSRWASAVNGANTATWTPNLPTRGIYDVYVWYVAGSNRTPSAAYTVTHLGGQSTLSGSSGISQKVNGSQWVKIGSWEFNNGTGGSVLLDSVASLNGGDPNAVVSADAVQFVLVQATAEEYVVDNTSAGFSASSNWFTSTSVGGYLGSNYHARATAAVSDPASWSVTLPNSGSYEVYVRWTAGTNRATAAPYVVQHAGGSSTVTANQQTNGGAWMSLGIYNFNAGTGTRVLLSCWTSSGDYVIADAIKLVKR